MSRIKYDNIFSPVAVLIFKNDGRDEDAWRVALEEVVMPDTSMAKKVMEEQNQQRREAGYQGALKPTEGLQENLVFLQSRKTKVDFLSELQRWNEKDKKMALVIYAHGAVAGQEGLALGLAPTDGNGPNEKTKSAEELRKEVVSWEELAEALPNGVNYLALLGCRTTGVLDAWRTDGPVRVALLATTESLDASKWMSVFTPLISLDPVTLDVDVPEMLMKRFDGKIAAYWVGRDGWQTAPPEMLPEAEAAGARLYDAVDEAGLLD